MIKSLSHSVQLLDCDIEKCWKYITLSHSVQFVMQNVLKVIFQINKTIRINRCLFLLLKFLLHPFTY